MLSEFLTISGLQIMFVLFCWVMLFAVGWSLITVYKQLSDRFRGKDHMPAKLSDGSNNNF
jgi:DNA-binding transcriptional regulator of glucitol operon